MFCNKCGAKLAENSINCNYCDLKSQVIETGAEELPFILSSNDCIVYENTKNEIAERLLANFAVGFVLEAKSDPIDPMYKEQFLKCGKCLAFHKYFNFKIGANKRLEITFTCKKCGTINKGNVFKTEDRNIPSSLNFDKPMGQTRKKMSGKMTLGYQNIPKPW